MKKEKDILECGRIVKQIAPVLGLTIDKFEELLEDSLINTKAKKDIKKESIHKYFMGSTWPFEGVGYYEVLAAITDFLEYDEDGQKRTFDDEEKTELEEKKKKIKKILGVAFMDLDNLSCHYSESNHPDKWPTEHRVNMIERIMQDIDKLDIETLYVFNRYFEAFASIDENDLKLIDFMDVQPSIDEFERAQLQREVHMPCETVLDNIDNIALQQWLELRSRKNYKDTVRKLGARQVASIKEEFERKVSKLGITNLLPLLNFIDYLIENKKGSFFEIDKTQFKLLLACKYWLGHPSNMNIDKEIIIEFS